MIVTTLEIQFRPGVIDAGMRLLDEILVDTRAFPGCHGVEVLVDTADAARVLIVERWATEADDLAYLAWRSGEGRVDLGALLSKPSKLLRFGPVSSL